MRLVARFEKVENEIYKSLPKGVYFVLGNQKGDEVRINKHDFDNWYKESSEEKSSEEVSVGENPLKLEPASQTSAPDFSKLMKFISERIESDDLDLSSEKEYYELISSEQILLQLPWEDILNKNVIRLVASDYLREEYKQKNILIAFSHARLGVFDNIVGNLREETAGLYKHILDEKFFMRADLLKHLNDDNISNVNLQKFGYIHFMMHGDDDGKLWFENNINYKTPSKTTADYLFRKLPDCSFELLFFSGCYFAGGLKNDEPSISYLSVREGRARFAIGYRHKVKSEYAKEFAIEFYRYLTSGFCVAGSFLKTVENKKRAGQYPLLYASASADLNI